MLLVKAPIGQELDPLEQLQEHEVDEGDGVAGKELAVALGLENFHEGLNLLQAIVSDLLLVGTLQVARLRRYFAEINKNVSIHFYLALIIQAICAEQGWLVFAGEVLHDC